MRHKNREDVLARAAEWGVVVLEEAGVGALTDPVQQNGSRATCHFCGCSGVVGKKKGRTGLHRANSHPGKGTCRMFCLVCRALHNRRRSEGEPTWDSGSDDDGGCDAPAAGAKRKRKRPGRPAADPPAAAATAANKPVCVVQVSSSSESDGESDVDSEDNLPLCLASKRPCPRSPLGFGALSVLSMVAGMEAVSPPLSPQLKMMTSVFASPANRRRLRYVPLTPTAEEEVSAVKAPAPRCTVWDPGACCTCECCRVKCKHGHDYHKKHAVEEPQPIPAHPPSSSGSHEVSKEALYSVILQVPCEVCSGKVRMTKAYKYFKTNTPEVAVECLRLGCEHTRIFSFGSR